MAFMGGIHIVLVFWPNVNLHHAAQPLTKKITYQIVIGSQFLTLSNDYTEKIKQ